MKGQSRVAELPLSQRPPRVLNADLARRLTQVNDAARVLRDLGCRVVGQDLRLGQRQRPLLKIDAPTPPLRETCTSTLNRREKDGRSVTIAYWRGIEIGWEHAA